MSLQDTFGLAVLHQLRGRTGRGPSQAYAYLMYQSQPKSDALERLHFLCEKNHLGAGFEIARCDLEMRGAGGLLGKAQKGARSRPVNITLDEFRELLHEAGCDLAAQGLLDSVVGELAVETAQAAVAVALNATALAVDTAQAAVAKAHMPARRSDGAMYDSAASSHASSNEVEESEEEEAGEEEASSEVLSEEETPWAAREREMAEEQARASAESAACASIDEAACRLMHEAGESIVGHCAFAALRAKWVMELGAYEADWSAVKALGVKPLPSGHLHFCRADAYWAHADRLMEGSLFSGEGGRLRFESCLRKRMQEQLEPVFCDIRAAAKEWREAWHLKDAAKMRVGLTEADPNVWRGGAKKAASVVVQSHATYNGLQLALNGAAVVVAGSSASPYDAAVLAADSLQEKGVLTGYKEAVTAVAADDDYFAVGHIDGTVRLFDRSFAFQAQLPSPVVRLRVSALALHAGQLVSGQADRAQLYTLATLNLTKTIAHDRLVDCVDLGDTALLTGEGQGRGKLRICWQDGSERHTCNLPGEYSTEVRAVKLVGEIAAVAYSSGRLTSHGLQDTPDMVAQLYSVTSGELVRSLLVPRNRVCSMSLCGSTWLCGGGDGHVRVWSAKSTEDIDVAVVGPHDDGVHGVALAPSAGLILCLSHVSSSERQSEVVAWRPLLPPPATAPSSTSDEQLYKEIDSLYERGLSCHENGPPDGTTRRADSRKEAKHGGEYDSSEDMVRSSSDN